MYSKVPSRPLAILPLLLLVAFVCAPSGTRAQQQPVEPILVDFNRPRNVPTVDATRKQAPTRTVSARTPSPMYADEWWEMPPDAGMPADPVLATIYERLELGTRFTKYSLSSGEYTIEDGTGFIGNVRNLQETQNYSPFKLFIDYWFIPWVGAEFTFDGIEVQAVNENNGESDGRLEMSGPIFSVVGRWPNTSRFTPYVGLGFAPWNAEFTNATWWHLGYPDPESWEADGKPKTREGGRRRTITASDETGTVMFMGVACHITRNWSADILLRSMSLSSEVNYVRAENGSISEDIDGTFPLDHTTFGLGVRYSF